MSLLTDIINDKVEVVSIAGIEFEFRPMKAKHASLFKQEKGKEMEMMIAMLTATLQDTDPTITLKEVEDLPFMILTDAMEALMKVNGIDTGNGESTEDSAKFLK